MASQFSIMYSKSIARGDAHELTYEEVDTEAQLESRLIAICSKEQVSLDAIYVFNGPRRQVKMKMILEDTPINRGPFR